MFPYQLWIVSVIILMVVTSYDASRLPENKIKTSVFLSPPFFLGPGSVVDHIYSNISFPRGHIALKDFTAEVVDEYGIPVPLHETYLHHWVVQKYYGKKVTDSGDDFSKDVILARNSGVCKNTLGQYYGLGSETRKTSTWVPDPYGIVVGDPKEVPNGYEERWLMNIHAIDTRGVKDRVSCTECKCSLYNVTENEHGQALAKDYIGGLHCCYDGTHCELNEGYKGGEIRKLYLRYTVKWAEWDEAIVPVKIYIFDITDSGTFCKVEYQVEACGIEATSNEICVDTKRNKGPLPHGGDLVYGVSHQHSGGLGAALYGQDGRLLCSSMPTYGKGTEAGNEEGYIVGMSACYPKPGSVKISDGEILIHESNYSSSRVHYGVMGLFYILVAESQQEQKYSMIFNGLTMPWRIEGATYPWAYILVAGIVVTIIFGISYDRSRRNVEGYQSL